jgi:hypothetical protein
MALDMAKHLETQCGGTWSYDCLARVGACAIDGKPLTVCLRLGGSEGSWVQRPPDVLEVQRWFEQLLAAGPTTVEAVAVAAAKHWGMAARASGFTETHGTITFQVPA